MMSKDILPLLAQIETQAGRGISPMSSQCKVGRKDSGVDLNSVNLLLRRQRAIGDRFVRRALYAGLRRPVRADQH
jgi:hypothetical protein